MNSKTQNIAIKVEANVWYSVGKVICSYNSIYSNSVSGTDVSIGGEGNIDNSFDGSEIIGNYYSGYLRNYPTETNTTIHAFLLSCGINFDIKYNFIENTQLALVVKSNGNTYSENGVYYNLIKNSMQGIWFRGVNGIKCYGNTVYNDDSIAGDVFLFNKGIYMDEDSTNPGAFCEDIDVRNCIVWNLAPTSGDRYCFGVDEHAALNGCNFDYCIGGSDSGTGYYKFGETEYSSLSDAKLAGKMLNSSNTDPELSSLLIPGINGSAIGNGQNLVTEYEDGLDSSTDWGDEDTVPNIVMKKQGINWDIGAYVH